MWITYYVQVLWTCFTEIITDVYDSLYAGDEEKFMCFFSSNIIFDSVYDVVLQV